MDRVKWGNLGQETSETANLSSIGQVSTNFGSSVYGDRWNHRHSKLRS